METLCYTELRRRADRISTMRRERLGRACSAAGLEVCQLHNALVGLHYGRPWRKVNYSKARLARRISSQPSPMRLVDSLYHRGRTCLSRDDGRVVACECRR